MDYSNPTFSIIEDPTGYGNDKVLSMTGNSNYPIYKITFKGDILSKPGKYTVVLHANCGSETNGGRVRFIVNRCFNGAPEMGAIEFSPTAYSETKYSLTVITPEEFEVGELTADTFTTTGAFSLDYIYFFMLSYKGKTVYFDDIEICYEEYADITFHNDGPTAEVTDTASADFGLTHRSIEPGKTLPTVSSPGSGYSFAG